MANAMSPAESRSDLEASTADDSRDRLAEVHLRHLRYFVVAAEEENFNRAAERLNIAQPALSRRIRDLEEAIGVTLFTREHKRVQLTEAGRTLLDDIRQILFDFSRAAARCRRVGRSETNELHIGINNSALRHEQLSRAFRDFSVRHPEVNLKVGSTSPTPLFDAIASGVTDGGFIYTRPYNDPAFSSVEVARDRFVIALAADHPLVAKSSIRLRDLRQEKFLWLPRESAPALHDRMLRACEAGGLVPRIDQRILSETTRLHLVSEGLGVTFVTSAFADFRPDHIVLLPVVDFEMDLVLEFVWRSDNPSRFLRLFSDIVRDIDSTSVTNNAL